MKNEARPKQVQDALWHADQDALSRMGRKGAEHAIQNRDLRKAANDANLREIALEKAQTESISSEGDVLPPDPGIIAELKD